ncbi:hypothetical protein [Sporosarcina sp. OR05]|uniref:hypothetical protein n=1 Tax=Sporosarcina sp. OR05 TaxID=2969819 RepID=UPI00352A43B7
MKKTDEKWLFIGTDQRMLACSRLMEEWGNNTFHYDGNEYSEELASIVDHYSPTHVVFPILQMSHSIPVEKLKPHMKLFTGVASKDWLLPYEVAGNPVHSYLHEVEYVWENARLTAEGFLLEYYASTKRLVFGEEFTIAGFGKVAKATADVLSKLGASVTILARSADQIGEASALGYQTERLETDTLTMDGTLINTIPAKWLRVKENDQFRIFDLASAPGCLKANSPDEYYTIHLGLPGKHFPVDAAKALAAALLRMNSR